jgi:solute carrier family 25 iron transporter 28/37
MCHKQHNTMLNVMRTMVQEEGLLRPIKGMNAMALGAGPAHAMYFTALEKVKEAAHHRGGISEHAAGGLSAVLATMLHDAFMTPAEVVKQRMQMCCSPFKSCTQATMAIYQAEGLRAFYRSYFTQLTMNVPFQVSKQSFLHMDNISLFDIPLVTTETVKNKVFPFDQLCYVCISSVQ